MMRLAFYTYSYIDRLGMEPEPVLRVAAESGYTGIDLSATWRADLDPALFPAERREEIRSLCRSLRLRVEALVTHLPLVNALWDEQPINLPAAVELAAAFDCPVVTTHIGSAAASGRCERDGWDLAVRHLREVCADAGRRGVTLCLDAVFPGFLTDTPEKVVRLIEEVGSPYLRHNLDPCYLAVAGFDLRTSVRLLAPYSAHVHVKDYVGSYPDFEHRIPGRGTLDHRLWIEELMASGYSGAAAVECFIDHPLADAAQIGIHSVRDALVPNALEID